MTVKQSKYLLIIFCTFLPIYFAIRMSAALPSPAASRNKQPILDVIKPKLLDLYSQRSRLHITEIASGTGEHAAYFKSELPFALFQPTEPNSELHESIKAWCDKLDVLPPLCLDVNNFKDESIFPIEFRKQNTNAMICINMIHISPFSSTPALFKIAQTMLNDNGILITYGPYRVKGYMVQSNIDFDLNLKSRNIEWGIRDLEVVEKVANENDFILEDIHEMPANNLTLIFRKQCNSI